MSETNQVNVYAAFETLLEELEAQIDSVSQSGAQAFAERDYDRARVVLDRADQLSNFRDKITGLRSEWQEVTGTNLNGGIVMSDISDELVDISDRVVVTRTSAGRLQRGLRTPESTYYEPILDALQELGGRAKMNVILTAVEQRMRDTLTEYDYQPLNSDPDAPRWRNAAQWARNAMVKDGKLRSDSPRGIWELQK